MRISILATIAATGAITIPAVALAADATVPGQFPTIQQAVRGAADGNGDGRIVIRVAPGTYSENVRIRRSGIHLKGSGAATTMIQAASDDSSVVDISGVSNVKLSGFTVTGSARHEGIKVRRVDSVSITDNTVTGNRHGITMRDSDDGTIIDNRISDNKKSGLKFRNSDDNTVRGNAFAGNRKGIDLRGGADNEVVDNQMSDHRDVGIRVRDDAEGTTVDGNRIADNGGDGVRLLDVSRTRITNNEVLSNGENGVRMRDTENTVIGGNTLQMNIEYGLRRRDDRSDDYDNTQSGDQPPPGNSTISNNIKGDIRTD
jgi:parallel beta-helix repeat protein